jgi:NDP-sugar pyrophosphorylase family protein
MSETAAPGAGDRAAGLTAVILCAGLGTRMQPLTYYVNKGMIPVAGKPILEHIIAKLVHQGFRRSIVAVSRHGEQVEHYFGKGERFGAHLRYVHSPEPQGTAGELHKMRDLLEGEDHFLVHYGDIITNLDSARMAASHLGTGAVATVGLVTGVHVHTGVGEVDPEGRLTYFAEKPPLGRPCHAAVDVFSRRVLDYVRPGQDLSTDTIPALMAAGEDVRGFIDEAAYWQDVGRLSDIDEASRLARGDDRPPSETAR